MKSDCEGVAHQFSGTTTGRCFFYKERVIVTGFQADEMNCYFKATQKKSNFLFAIGNKKSGDKSSPATEAKLVVCGAEKLKPLIAEAYQHSVGSEPTDYIDAAVFSKWFQFTPGY